METLSRTAPLIVAALSWIILSAPAGAAANYKALDWTQHQKPPAGARIVLIEPEIELAELLASGRTEPRADWTQAAKRLYSAEVRRTLGARGANLLPDYAPAAELPPDARERQVLHLHEAVGTAVLQHHYGSLKLPNKPTFDWRLGPGVDVLRQATGADYALFTYVEDSYTSAGRAAVMVFGALLGAGVSGGVQLGFTSLVDLRTGRLMWFSFLVDSTGDLRDEKGARETVDDLFNGFPL
jgi:hypothetical protein